MVTLCSWCGKYITGQPVATGEGYYSTWGTDKPLMVHYEVGFCCHGCAWCWGIKEHGMMGITGEAARKHLIREHGLIHPPGEPAGKESWECYKFFKTQQELIYECVRPDIGNIFSVS